MTDYRIHLNAIMEGLKEKASSEAARKNPNYVVALALFAELMQQLPTLMEYTGEEVPEKKADDTAPEDMLGNLLESVKKPDRLN